MPIYEYACNQCGHELEALQKMSENPLTACPECGEETLKKLVSAPAFRLKGAGWYETDFKQDKQRNLSSTDDKKEAAKKDSAEGSAKKPDETANTAKKTEKAGSDKKAKPETSA